MSDVRILGEWGTELAGQLGQLNWKFEGEVCRVDGTVTPQSAFMRAWLRAEAELLLDHAADMALGRYEHRMPEVRRTDAMMLVIERLIGARAVLGSRADPSELT